MLLSFSTYKNQFLLAALLVFSAGTSLFAQEPDTVKLKEVIVTGISVSDPRNTSLNVEPLATAQMEQYGAANLCDGIARMPGVSQMTTGVAIAKPVIRGLYGNRILVLLGGLRFDNQQWQDEHGLGMSQIGIDKVEIIKGPASVIYGTDALGGVINIIMEQPDSLHPKQLDFNTRFYTNTLGTLTDIGYKRTRETKWWRVRAGVESHADYSDGNGTRVLNSRNSGYFLQTGFGSTHSRWKTENTYNFSLNNFGFILEDIHDFFDADARWSRSMVGPHHIVVLNVLNSQNTRYLRNSILRVNAGFQSNLRMEDEGGGQISLNMHLMSGLLNVKWEKQVKPHTLLVVNHQQTFENNTNYGARIIVPDANMYESSLAFFLRHTHDRVILEAGAGAGIKDIMTKVTTNLSSPDSVFPAITVVRPSFNGTAGLSWLANEFVTLKWNTSSGFRAPNLAELNSNGLHEGTFRYEIGDPNLAIEQNVNSDLSLEVNKKRVFFYISAFANRFFNYIYLAPTSEEYYGFQIFRYEQQNAFLYGGEAVFNASTAALPELSMKTVFSTVTGVLDHGGYLPYIPAWKATGAIRYEKKQDRKIKGYYAEPEFVYVLPQQQPAQFETATVDYGLLNFTAGCTISAGKNDLVLSLAGQNLLNKVYADHLSRIKYYGLYNPGRNFVISLRMPLGLR